MPPGPDLEVVIVSHGAEELLWRCLRSLEEHPAGGEMRVTVVDSGSPDSTPDMVERQFPSVRLLRRGNIGFSAANNLVLRESEAAAVLLLNPDTEVYAGTLDAALARLRSEPRIGMVGCKLVTESGELDHASKRSFPTPLSALAHFTGVGRSGEAAGALSQYRATHLGDDEAGEVDAVNGAFMLCRAEAVREVGLLDEGYWLYMEDLDWCHRFWDAGWKVFYEPAGVALHVKGGSSAGRRAAAPGDRLPPRHGPLLPPLRRPRAQSAAQRRRLRGHRRETGRQPRPHRARRTLDEQLEDLDPLGDDDVLEGEAAGGVGPEAVVDRLAEPQSELGQGRAEILGRVRGRLLGLGGVGAEAAGDRVAEGQHRTAGRDSRLPPRG